MNVARIILESLYFMLPAYAANMAPVFAKKLLGARWSTPINERALGAHKTYRGFVAGILAAIAVVSVQRYWQDFALLPYAQLNVWVYGFLFGCGALAGDAVKSYFKRRRAIAPGQPWLPWDQVDFSIGTLMALAPIYLPPLPHIVCILVLSPILSWCANRIGFMLRIKETKW